MVERAGAERSGARASGDASKQVVDGRRDQRCAGREQRPAGRVARGISASPSPPAHVLNDGPEPGAADIGQQAAPFRRGGRVSAGDRAAHRLGVLGGHGQPQAGQHRDGGEREGRDRALHRADSSSRRPEGTDRLQTPKISDLTPFQARLFQRVSGAPRRLFSWRAMTKRASERRFRYLTVQGPTGSWRPRAMTMRSARRQTVRATWSCAAPGRAAGEDEVLEGRELLGEPVHELLERDDVALLDPRHGHLRLVLLEDAEIGAQVKELVLDRAERFDERLVQSRRERDAEDAVQLVHRPVGLDAQRVLADALAAAQTRRPVVARARVDLRDARHA